MSGECLRYVYDLLYDLKTERQVQREVEYLAHRLAGIAKLRREDGKPIDGYIRQILSLKDGGK